MPDRSSTPPPQPTWSEVLVDLDGHLHNLARDCQHRPDVDACRVCCPHTDDVRVTAPEPADQPSDFSPLVTLVCAAAAFLIIGVIGAAALAVCAWIGGLR